MKKCNTVISLSICGCKSFNYNILYVYDIFFRMNELLITDFIVKNHIINSCYLLINAK